MGSKGRSQMPYNQPGMDNQIKGGQHLPYNNPAHPNMNPGQMLQASAQMIPRSQGNQQPNGMKGGMHPPQQPGMGNHLKGGPRTSRYKI